MLEIKSTDRLLIVAPHPDDESIGCGGLLSMYASQCDVLLLTDGRMGHKGGDNDKTNEDELVKVREKEFLAATEFAGVHNTIILRIPDQMLQMNAKMVQKVNIAEYDYIFIPNRQEYNLDHSAVFPIIKKMMRKQKSKARLLEYEVWSPLNKPNHAIIIDDAIEKKIDLVSFYQSQISLKDYAQFCRGLAQYRGVFFNSGYAEAYFEEEKVSLLLRLYRILPYRFRVFIYKKRNGVSN